MTPHPEPDPLYWIPENVAAQTVTAQVQPTATAHTQCTATTVPYHTQPVQQSCSSCTKKCISYQSHNSISSGSFCTLPSKRQLSEKLLQAEQVSHKVSVQSYTPPAKPSTSKRGFFIFCLFLLGCASCGAHRLWRSKVHLRDHMFSAYVEYACLEHSHQSRSCTPMNDPPHRCQGFYACRHLSSEPKLCP